MPDAAPRPAYSVIMAARDASGTVGRAVASVLAQHEPSFELIVVDDASTDGTAAAVAAAADGDARVRVVAGDGGGAWAARNAGARIATAPVLTFLDADDAYDPRYLGTVGAALADGDGWDVVAPDADAVHADGSRTRVFGDAVPVTVRLADHVRRPAVPVWAAVRREAFKAAGGFRDRYAEDYDLWLRMLAAGARVRRLPGALVTYDASGGKSQDRERQLGSVAASLEELAATGLDGPVRRLVDRRIRSLRAEPALWAAKCRVRDGHYRGARAAFWRSRAALTGMRGAAVLACALISPRLYAAVSRPAQRLASPAVRPTRVADAAAMALAAQVLGMGTSLVVGVAVARTLGPEGRGLLAVVMQTASLLVAALGLGVGTSTVHQLVTGRTGPGVAMAGAAALAVGSALVALPVAWLALASPWALVPGVGALAFALAVATVPLGLFAGWLNAIALGAGRPVAGLAFALASAAGTLGALAAAYAVRGPSLTATLTATVAGTLAGLVACVAALLPVLGPVRLDLSAMRDAVGLSGRAWAADVAGALHNRQDTLVLGGVAGAASVGAYSVGVSLAEIAWYGPGALASAVVAGASRAGSDGGAELAARSARIAVVSMVPVIAVVAALSPWVVPLVWGPGFAAATPVLLALAVGVLADGVTRILWSHLGTRGVVPWRAAAASTVLNLLAALLLAWRFGAVGAALASSLSYTAILLATLRAFGRDSGMRARDALVPRAEDVALAMRTLRRLAGPRPDERECS